jgi:hypothetical protein
MCLQMTQCPLGLKRSVREPPLWPDPMHVYLCAYDLETADKARAKLGPSGSLPQQSASTKRDAHCRESQTTAAAARAPNSKVPAAIPAEKCTTFGVTC